MYVFAYAVGPLLSDSSPMTDNEWTAHKQVYFSYLNRANSCVQIAWHKKSYFGVQVGNFSCWKRLEEALLGDIYVGSSVPCLQDSTSKIHNRKAERNDGVSRCRQTTCDYSGFVKQSQKDLFTFFRECSIFMFGQIPDSKQSSLNEKSSWKYKAESTYLWYLFKCWWKMACGIVATAGAEPLTFWTAHLGVVSLWIPSKKWKLTVVRSHVS